MTMPMPQSPYEEGPNDPTENSPFESALSPLNAALQKLKSLPHKWVLGAAVAVIAIGVTALRMHSKPAEPPAPAMPVVSVPSAPSVQASMPVRVAPKHKHHSKA